jgi:large repetitive protein
MNLPPPPVRSPRLALLLALLAGALLGACGSGAATLECFDGIDNDGDGFIDAEDPSCIAGHGHEHDNPITACNNGIDDDGDGLIDYPADPGCRDPFDDDERDLPQCSDGIDNDGDGLIDYPADPGCFSRLQDSELDSCPDGPGCPECADGIDNDGDGLIDWPADPGCRAASGAREALPDPAACPGMAPQSLPLHGWTTGMLSPGPSQLSSPCGGAGPEHVYEIYVAAPAVLRATTVRVGTQIDTVLYLRTRCGDPGTELGCNSDAGESLRGATLIVPVDPGYYYLVVDGQTAAAGAYQLQVELFPGIGSACQADAEEPCAPGLVCRVVPDAAAPTCERPVCSDGRDDDGDGLVDYPDDPGCRSPDDDSEDDDCPAGDGCPQCGNGIDDDEDGEIDFPDDPNCTAASDDDESCESDPTIPVTAPTLTGSTEGLGLDFTSCTLSSSQAPDQSFLLRLPVPLTSLRIDTNGSSFDTVLSLRSAACEATEYLQCDDDGGVGLQSLLQLGAVAAGDYVIVIDGYGASSWGNYVLNVRGVAAPGASCTSPLFAAGVLACPTGQSCDGTSCAP